MTQTIAIPHPTSEAAPSSAQVDFERLDCFRVAVEFQTLAASIGSSRSLGTLRNQLDRASTSIALNVAEGVGRHSPADKARFFAIARGSASECAAALELLAARGLLSPQVHRHAPGLLVWLLQMLTRLILRLAPEA